MPDIAALDRLKSQLLTSGLQERNNALYQVINQLIDFLRQNINSITATIGSTGGGGGAIASQTFVTTNNDQATLPNSRQITAGFGIQFNETGTRLIISASIPMPRDGQDGERGPIGPPGIQGLQGPQGIMGPPGSSAESEVYVQPFIGNSLHDGSTVTGEYRQVI